MDKYVFKKYFVIGIIVLFLGASIVPNICGYAVKIPNMENRKSNITITNLIIVPDNYSKIQDAIDNATIGDTIFVRSGIYYETLEVRKSLTLIGENKDNTIIDGMGESFDPVFYLRGEEYGINLSGFTIQNASRGVLSYYSNNNISENIIKNTDDAIDFRSFSDNNNIINNLFINNDWVLHLDGSNNIIMGNNITTDDGNGIHLIGGSDNYVINNFISNTWEAIQINSYYNIIMGNKITNCQTGIRLKTDGAYNKIIENEISTDTEEGIGIFIEGHENIISGNTVKNNHEGIHLIRSSNLLMRNSISNNIFAGIHISGTITKENTIIGNNIKENYIGIYLRQASENRFYCNNFIDNENDDDSENAWNTYFFNYWGRSRLIKIIRGRFFWPDGIDWFPARKRFNIL